jgi:3-deoxy-manno-octulosonate cytidylyltransferase (CMP-KDO synthetase)
VPDHVTANPPGEPAAVTAAVVIPARYASTRFPGKPLARDTGRFLIQHVYERATQATTIRRVLVATDDQRILEAVRSFGGEAVMTRADHPSGTDRVAEAAASLDCDIVVNIQGDEPELEPACIDGLVDRLARDRDCVMATAACPFAAVPDSSPTDANAVKVVIDGRGRALYFSRSLIPCPAAALPSASATPAGPPYLHLGIYAYRRDFLMTLASLPPTPLERIERLEQLRALENGYRIAVVVVDKAAVGIDAPADYAAFVRRWQRSRDRKADPVVQRRADH